MKQKKDQAAMINARKRENMQYSETGDRQMPHRSFVNAGAPSHGVTQGSDGDNANNGVVMKKEVCGYGMKGYNPAAWQY